MRAALAAAVLLAVSGCGSSGSAPASPGVLPAKATAASTLIDEPDGKRVAVSLGFDLPPGKDVRGFTGTAAIRKPDGSTIWTGPVTFAPDVSERGKGTALIAVPYDDSDAGLRDLRSARAFPAEVRVERIDYADGSSETF